MIRIIQGDANYTVDNVTMLRYSAGMTNIPNEILAYSAGVIDSDGSIGIRRSTYAKRVRGDAHNPIYSARVCVKQVEPDAVQLMKGAFGGSLMIERSSLKNGRPFYYWEIHSRQAAAMLRMLLPYLRIKRKQAENCLALYMLIDGAKRTKPLGTRTMPHWTGKVVTVRTMGHTDEHVAACEALYLKGKQLNSVGVKGVADECQDINRGLPASAADVA